MEREKRGRERKSEKERGSEGGWVTIEIAGWERQSGGERKGDCYGVLFRVGRGVWRRWTPTLFLKGSGRRGVCQQTASRTNDRENERPKLGLCPLCHLKGKIKSGYNNRHHESSLILHFRTFFFKLSLNNTLQTRQTTLQVRYTFVLIIPSWFCFAI